MCVSYSVVASAPSPVPSAASSAALPAVAAASTPKTTPSETTFFIRLAGREDTPFTVGHGCALQPHLEEYCQRLGLRASFFFSGQPLTGHETPADLGMQDGAQIDAHVAPEPVASASPVAASAALVVSNAAAQQNETTSYLTEDDHFKNQGIEKRGKESRKETAEALRKEKREKKISAHREAGMKPPSPPPERIDTVPTEESKSSASLQQAAVAGRRAVEEVTFEQQADNSSSNTIIPQPQQGDPGGWGGGAWSGWGTNNIEKKNYDELLEEEMNKNLEKHD